MKVLNQQEITAISGGLYTGVLALAASAICIAYCSSKFQKINDSLQNYGILLLQTNLILEQQSAQIADLKAAINNETCLA